MEANNIILVGVGGQGLVLATQIIADAATFAGLDVKTNDVVGLSQRGGKVWGSVKLGKKVYSPNINPAEADLLIAFEKLEARRFRAMLKEGNSVAVINEYEMVPTLVQQEKTQYEADIEEKVGEFANEIVTYNATLKAADLGNKAVANIILLGIAARYIPIPQEDWIKSIEKNVPAKFTELNIDAFMRAFKNEL